MQQQVHAYNCVERRSQFVAEQHVVTAGLKLHIELSYFLGSMAQLLLRYSAAAYMLIGKITVASLTGTNHWLTPMHAKQSTTACLCVIGHHLETCRLQEL